MSISADTEGPIDYSDFEYQFVQTKHQNTGGGNSDSRSSTVQFEIEPLETLGGLANNEVAELAYMELQVSLEFEQESETQGVASATEYRGTMGVNLNGKPDDLPIDGGVEQNVSVEVIEEDNVTTAADSNGRTINRDNIFAPFRVHGAPGFDDSATGTGGGPSDQTLVLERNWRDLTNRGPVIDNTDDLNIVSTLISNDSNIIEAGITRMHLVWDVSETSDAGRAFSVPMDD